MSFSLLSACRKEFFKILYGNNSDRLKNRIEKNAINVSIWGKEWTKLLQSQNPIRMLKNGNAAYVNDINGKYGWIELTVHL